MLAKWKSVRLRFGDPWFDSRDQVIPNTFKRVVLVPLLGANKLRVSITTELAVTVF